MSWLANEIVSGPVPRHVAFIMDGNRRWARAMGYTDPSTGHEFGSVRGEQVLGWCRAANIHHVTVYVASLDNLRKRSDAEIQRLMSLIERFVEARLRQRDCRLHLAGRIEYLPGGIAAGLRRACEASAQFATDFHLTAAIAYDGRTEIVDAVRSWLGKAAKTGATLEQLAHTLSVEDISAHLYTGSQPWPELVIRAGGDFRLSCFMPWQTAYSHLYFSQAYWPALTEEEFLRAMRWYAASVTRATSDTRRTTGLLGGPFRRLARRLRGVTRSPYQQPAVAEIPKPQAPPRHVAILLESQDLDAPRRLLPASGTGVVNLRELLTWCKEFEIEAVTLGLMAAAEVSRPTPNVHHRLHELVVALEDVSDSPIKPRLRLHGMLGLLPEPASSRIAAVAARTTQHTGLKTNLAICYDGRSEVVQAVRELLAERARQGQSIDEIRDQLETENIARILCAPGEPDLDLIIVISSHQALNGFLLWQAVRSEFWFWSRGSRFRRADFVGALRDFGSRSRRFGA